MVTKWTKFSLVLLMGCSEYELGTYVEPVEAPIEVPDECIDSEMGFDIEEVSTLQDAFGLPYVRDGLTLATQDSFTAGGKTWRPVGVEVLVMFPEWYFNNYNDSNHLRVHVYDSANPQQSAAYTQTVRIEKNNINWAHILLPDDADWSGADRDQVGAWVYFDFSEITPMEGFNSDYYFVAVEWDGVGIPNVGYSNFELACVQNWTDYGDGAWKQNSGNDCSWPMFKIDVETRTPDECD